MIQTKSVEEASVLVVGAGSYVDEILKHLTSNGINRITRLTSNALPEATSFATKTITEDPVSLIAKDTNLFKSYDLIISVDQPRPFELSLSDIRWPKDGAPKDPDLPFIVSRNSGNACKFRCQYRELQVDRSRISRFVSLLMDLPAWTEEKRRLVSSTIQEQFNVRENPDLQAYFAVGSAFVQLQQSTGFWPGAQDKHKLQKAVKSSGSLSETRIQHFIDQFCDHGLSGPEETQHILARFLVTDAVKLLTGKGWPINTSDIQAIFQSFE